MVERLRERMHGECNGMVSAAHCPACGDCTCNNVDPDVVDVIDPRCALHGEQSTHLDDLPDEDVGAP